MKFVPVLLISLSGLFVLEGCRGIPKIQENPRQNVPATFNGRTDSTGVGSKNWRDFFIDKVLVGHIETALRNNPDLLVAQQRINASRAMLNYSKRAVLPTLDLAGRAGTRRIADYTMDGVGNFDTNLSPNIKEDKRIPNPLPDYYVGFESSWEIDLRGKLRNEKKAALNRFLASEQGKNLLITQLIAEVAKNYYELVAMDTELEILRRNIVIQQKAMEMGIIQKEGGRATELAVKQFNAQLLHSKSMEAQVSQVIVEAEFRLNLLMGQYPQEIERNDLVLKDNFPSGITAGIPSQMLSRRPDIRQAEKELEAAHYDLKAARAAFLPALNITAYTAFNAFTTTTLFQAPTSLAWGVIGGITGPLINRNRVKAGYRVSEANYNEALLNYRKSLFRGFGEVVTSLKRIDNYYKVTTLKAEEVKVLNQATGISNDLFAAGYASYFEVMTAQRNALEAELELITVKKEQFFSLIDLYRALGGGWE